MSNNPSAFVMARLDEWEQAARDAQGPDGFGDTRTFYTTHGPHRDDWGIWTFHVDPARVLAQVAAMRAIVDDCADYIGSEAVTDGLSLRTLRHLAAVWSDHDQYDPAWAPEGE